MSETEYLYSVDIFILDERDRDCTAYTRIVRCDNTGVPGQLHYCRNGVVNNYALSFNLPIKTDITEIYFSWVNAPPLGLQKPDITVSLHSL